MDLQQQRELRTSENDEEPLAGGGGPSADERPPKARNVTRAPRTGGLNLSAPGESSSGRTLLEVVVFDQANPKAREEPDRRQSVALAGKTVKQSTRVASPKRGSPSLVNGARLRTSSLRGSWVRIPPPARLLFSRACQTPGVDAASRGL
jgi:hypothetical protein